MNEISPRRFNSRLGLTLFALYLTFYLGFVLISAFAADWMEVTVLGGLNLAILYGFGLILLALVLALFYGWGCRNDDDRNRPAAGSANDSSTESRA